MSMSATSLPDGSASRRSTGRTILARPLCTVAAAISMVFLIGDAAAQTASPLTIQPSTGRVNIGLGTTPSATLDVTGASNATDVFRVTAYGSSAAPFVLVNAGDWSADWQSINNEGYANYVMSIGTRGNAQNHPRSLITWGETILTSPLCQTCNVGIGTTTPTSKLHVVGTLSANFKQFHIPHPLEPAAKALVHAALEGPEHAVYYRGEGQLTEGQAVITLPRYFEALTRPEHRTVQLTMIDGWSPLYVVGTVTDGKFTVRTAGGGSPVQRFHWEVKAVRADGDPLVVERPHGPSAERPAPNPDAPGIALEAAR